MTIAEKSTELGIDLAQIALDANIIMTCTNDDIFKCYCAGGENKNINIFDDEGVNISDAYYRYMTEEFVLSTPLATIQSDFLDYINEQEFVPMPIRDVVTPKE
jgi:hypothetical protein